MQTGALSMGACGESASRGTASRPATAASSDAEDEGVMGELGRASQLSECARRCKKASAATGCALRHRGGATPEVRELHDGGVARDAPGLTSMGATAPSDKSSDGIAPCGQRAEGYRRKSCAPRRNHGGDARVGVLTAVRAYRAAGSRCATVANGLAVSTAPSGASWAGRRAPRACAGERRGPHRVELDFRTEYRFTAQRCVPKRSARRFSADPPQRRDSGPGRTARSRARRRGSAALVAERRSRRSGERWPASLSVFLAVDR